mmetsp:Transcript_12441/g.19684  ORF Transcript_12441/g.19684 Transcript_12441/m.19684 type:complete len:95 (+) Transcript_12441:131-415(+)
MQYTSSASEALFYFNLGAHLTRTTTPTKMFGFISFLLSPGWLDVNHKIEILMCAFRHHFIVILEFSLSTAHGIYILRIQIHKTPPTIIAIATNL